MRDFVFGSVILVVAMASACGGSDDGSRQGASSGGSNNTSGGSSSAGTTGGGSGGASGASGGGTTVTPSKCGTGPFPSGDGSSPLIDDIEDGNVAIPEVDGRGSKWFFETDGSTTGTSQPAVAAFAPVDGGADGTAKALHVAGDSFTTWGVVVGTGLNDALGLNCPYDATQYGGVSFYAKGSGTIRFAIAESAIYPTSLGGTCVSATPADADCYNSHGKLVTLSSDWTQYEMAWSDLAQGSWGVRAEFDPATIMLIEFAATNEQQPFDFWVDQLEFLPAGATGGGGASGTGGASGEGGAGGA